MKGQFLEILDFSFFSWISFSQAPPLGLFRILSKIDGDNRRLWCTTGFFDNGGKRKKIFNQKSFNYFGHLWEVELTYRKIFSFKFTLRWQQSNLVPIICHDPGGKITAGVDTGGNRRQVCPHLHSSLAWGNPIYERNLKQKISWHCHTVPLNYIFALTVYIRTLLATATTVVPTKYLLMLL